MAATMDMALVMEERCGPSGRFVVVRLNGGVGRESEKRRGREKRGAQGLGERPKHCL